MPRLLDFALLSDTTGGGVGFVRTLVVALAFCAAGAAAGVLAGSAPTHETSVSVRV